MSSSVTLSYWITKREGVLGDPQHNGGSDDIVRLTPNSFKLGCNIILEKKELEVRL
jgi:hypothetical protein